MSGFDVGFDVGHAYHCVRSHGLQEAGRECTSRVTDWTRNHMKRFQKVVQESFKYCWELPKEGGQCLSVLSMNTYSTAHLRHISKTTFKQMTTQIKASEAQPEVCM